MSLMAAVSIKPAKGHNLHEKLARYKPAKDCHNLGKEHDIRCSPVDWLICKDCGYRNPKDF